MVSAVTGVNNFLRNRVEVLLTEMRRDVENLDGQPAADGAPGNFFAAVGRIAEHVRTEDESQSLRNLLETACEQWRPW
jgi:hypothetical protein